MNSSGSTSIVRSFIIIFLAPLLLSCQVFARFEEPSTLTASNILKKELLSSEYHTVEEVVKNDGFVNHYSVRTSHQTFNVITTSSLAILVLELKAIATMQKIKTDDTAYESLKQSGKNTVEGVKNLFQDPEKTFTNAATGIQGLFNRAKGTVGKRKITGAEDSRVEQLIGLTKSKGEIATQFGVNMYSRNPILQQELDRLARADYLGGLGVGVASSFVGGVGGIVLTTSGTARLLNEAINTTPASELWLQNKKILLAITSDEDTVELFLNNPVFSPALQTLLANALKTMEGVENRELFIKVALQASTEEMAKIITEIAIMTAGYHQRIMPLAELSPLARLTLARKKDGSVIVLLPSDHIIWSEKVADAIDDIKNNNVSTTCELWTFGDFSLQATEMLKERGWKLYPKATTKLLKNE
ncbi:hypothetical protein [Desulfopila sp. IMCC35008]|uniref:hypothetical protein n=1 Tax=Desulfopila sp. IMCC35008 TaxID=2653858 RepID=UPI0013CFB352|nr:hypothetical protein [Desulfopila sp. IMCC35008]